MTRGDRLKDEGQELAERSNASFVRRMRRVAAAFVRRDGQVSSDDLRRYAARRGIRPRHPNAWGAIFRGTRWFILTRRKSEVASNHARWIIVWGLHPPVVRRPEPEVRIVVKEAT